LKHWGPDNYQTLCHIAVDASDLENVVVIQRTLSDSTTFSEVEFDIALTFGMTELAAQVCWKANVSCLFVFLEREDD
jgi:hypothetical protein